jgi:hypothetical protein
MKQGRKISRESVIGCWGRVPVELAHHGPSHFGLACGVFQLFLRFGGVGIVGALGCRRKVALHTSFVGGVLLAPSSHCAKT